MSSTHVRSGIGPTAACDWRAAGLRYFSYRSFLRQRFGCRVQKISVDAGFTCPNVDGRVALGGCTYCDNQSFSPSRRLPRQPIGQQVEEAIQRMRSRYACEHFIAYFQPATNTYAPVEQLRIVYEQAAQVVNIKLMKAGVVEALDIAAICRAAQLRLMIGGMVESILAMTMSAHFAAGQGGFSFVDLDTPMFMAENPFEGGFRQTGARLDLRHITAGHGVRPR